MNNSESPKYHVRDNHPAIIDRDTWNLVKFEIARRGSMKKEAVNKEQQLLIEDNKAVNMPC